MWSKFQCVQGAFIMSWCCSYTNRALEHTKKKIVETVAAEW